MAYTYEQFETAAGKAGLLDKFDKQDLVIAQSNPEYGISMLQLMKNRSGAKTTEQKVLADEAVRQLRNTYSRYTSGGRLPEYADEVIQQTDNYYAGQSAYRKALAEAEGYGSFDYDETLGDIFTRQNNLERERARADALATASAATGGRPSSYALTLAQQTAGDYDAQLDETILGLRKNAYQQALSAASKPSGSSSSSGSGLVTELTKEEKKENAKALHTYVRDSAANAVKSFAEKTGLDKVYNGLAGIGESVADSVSEGVVEPVSDIVGKLMVPSPEETDHVKALAQSIDGSIRISQMTGATDSQIRAQILGYFNNDGFVGNLSGGEWAWLMKYYEKYNLL